MVSWDFLGISGNVLRELPIRYSPIGIVFSTHSNRPELGDNGMT
jgi:hypothetical protein